MNLKKLYKEGILPETWNGKKVKRRDLDKLKNDLEFVRKARSFAMGGVVQSPELIAALSSPEAVEIQQDQEIEPMIEDQVSSHDISLPATTDQVQNIPINESMAEPTVEPLDIPNNPLSFSEYDKIPEYLLRPEELAVKQSLSPMDIPENIKRPDPEVMNKVAAPKKPEVSPLTDLVHLISKSEGTNLDRAKKAGFKNEYDVPYGYGKYYMPKKPLTEMSLNEVNDFQGKQASATKGKIKGTKKGTGAAGRYQFTQTTLSDLVKRMKKSGLLTGNEKFTPEIQDKIFQYMLMNDVGGKKFIEGKMSERDFQDKLANTWASIPDSSGKFKYGQPSIVDPKKYRQQIKGILDSMKKYKGKNSYADGGIVDNYLQNQPMFGDYLEPRTTEQFSPEDLIVAQEPFIATQAPEEYPEELSYQVPDQLPMAQVEQGDDSKIKELLAQYELAGEESGKAKRLSGLMGAFDKIRQGAAQFSSGMAQQSGKARVDTPKSTYTPPTADELYQGPDMEALKGKIGVYKSLKGKDSTVHPFQQTKLVNESGDPLAFDPNRNQLINMISGKVESGKTMRAHGQIFTDPKTGEKMVRNSDGSIEKLSDSFKREGKPVQVAKIPEEEKVDYQWEMFTPEQRTKFESIEKDYMKDVQDTREFGDIIASIEDLVESDISAAIPAIKRQLARSVGKEVGVMTDKDVEAFSGDQSLLGAMERFAKLKASGTMTDRDKMQYNKIIEITRRNLSKAMDNRAQYHTTRISRRIPYATESSIRELLSVEQSKPEAVQKTTYDPNTEIVKKASDGRKIVYDKKTKKALRVLGQ